MDNVSIDAQPRTVLGKHVGALRRSGITPIHVYGPGIESLSLQAPTLELIRAVTEVGYTTPLTLRVGDEERFVIVREIQRHPVSEQLLHVDLMQVSRTERRQAPVPLHFVGEASAAREEGAMLSEDLHALDVEALPTEMPSALTVDVSVLSEPDGAIHARDIELPPGVTLVTAPDAVVARIVHRRVAEEVAAAEEAVAGAPTEAAPPASAGDGAGGERPTE